MTLVRILDLAGEDVKGLPCDIRSRNADGSLKYPEQHGDPSYPAMTRLIAVERKRKQGVVWIYWSWDRRPQVLADGQSGATLDIVGDYYILVNNCPMCREYDHPGFVINAHQEVPCWQCNPTPSKR